MSYIYCVLYTCSFTFFLSSEEWSSQQQDCVQHLHDGVEGVMSLLQQFSQGQTRVERERSSAVQDSLTHCQTRNKQFQVTGQHLLGSHSVFEIQSFTPATQESLVSTADSLLTVALRPLLTGLSEQLTLQSSLLSQSTASLKTQVTQHWAVISCGHLCLSTTMYMYYVHVACIISILSPTPVAIPQ